jgi:hypothetical protein
MNIMEKYSLYLVLCARLIMVTQLLLQFSHFYGNHTVLPQIQSLYGMKEREMKQLSVYIVEQHTR